MAVRNLANIIDDIGRGETTSVNTYLKTIEYAVKLEDVETKFYGHMIASNGNGEIRLDDFIDFIVRHIIEYVIPRSKILEAEKKDKKSGLKINLVQLYKEAEKLFTPLKKTGEGGEMLLFIFGEVLLNLPQILCKMSVKTAKGVHFHGADGVHVGVDDKGKLELYWGESKFNTNFSHAISGCLDSIGPILKREDNADQVDLLLLQKYLDIGKKMDTTLFKEILDKDNSKFNQVKYCGLCLIGFDKNLYTSNYTKKIINKNFEVWKKKIANRIKDRGLETFNIHLFCLPFVSVEEFRKKFLKKMGL